MHAQRAMQRQGMAHRALRAVRRDGVDFTAVAQSIFERDQSFGLNAVVIGEQDDHGTYSGKEAGNGQARERAASRLVSRARAKV